MSNRHTLSQPRERERCRAKVDQVPRVEEAEVRRPIGHRFAAPEASAQWGEPAGHHRTAVGIGTSDGLSLCDHSTSAGCLCHATSTRRGPGMSPVPRLRRVRPEYFRVHWVLALLPRTWAQTGRRRGSRLKNFLPVPVSILKTDSDRGRAALILGEGSIRRQSIVNTGALSTP